METPSSPRELPIVGGHLALDFANTVDDPLGPARHDHASTYADLVRWCHRVGVVDEERSEALLRAAARHPRRAGAAMGRAHELRDLLNEVFGLALDGAELTQPWSRLREFTARAQGDAEVRSTGTGYEWAWPGTDRLDVVLHPVASAAAELLVSDELRRLKRCARCPWLFLDTSKNHSRRWCDMDDCGRAQKIERYVARRAAKRRSP